MPVSIKWTSLGCDWASRFGWSLDAYPDLVLSGKLEQISPVSAASGFSQRVRNCAVTFSLQGSDPKLMPDLSAAVDVLLDSVPNALVLPSRGGEDGEWAILRIR